MNKMKGVLAMYRVITTDRTLTATHVPFNGDTVIEFTDRVATVDDKEVADYLDKHGFYVEEIK